MVTVCGGAATTRSPRPRMEMLAPQCPRLRRLSGRAAALDLPCSRTVGPLPGFRIVRGDSSPAWRAPAPHPPWAPYPRCGLSPARRGHGFSRIPASLAPPAPLTSPAPLASHGPRRPRDPDVSCNPLRRLGRTVSYFTTAAAQSGWRGLRQSTTSVPRRGHCLRRSVNAAALFASAAPAAPLYSLTWHITSACYYVRT